MRFLILASALWGCTPTSSVPTGPSEVDPLAIYTDDSGELRATNEPRRMTASFTDEGVRITPVEEGGAFALEFGTASIGRDTLDSVGTATPTGAGRTVRYESGPVTTWYHHDDNGLEQGFDVVERVSGSGELVVQVPLGFENLVAERESAGIRFLDGNDTTRFRFVNLIVTDALGEEIPARMTLDCDGACVSYRIDDADAVYPLDVDPLLLSQELHFMPTGNVIGQLVRIGGARALMFDATTNTLLTFTRAPAGPWVPGPNLPGGAFPGVVDLDIAFDATNNNYFAVIAVPGAPQVWIDNGGGWIGPLPYFWAGTFASPGFGDQVAANNNQVLIADVMSGRHEVMTFGAVPVGLVAPNNTNYPLVAALPPPAVFIAEVDIDIQAGPGLGFAYQTNPVTGAQAWTTAPGFNVPPALPGAPVAAYVGHVDSNGTFVVFDNGLGGSDVTTSGAGINVPLFTDPLGTNGKLAFPPGGNPTRLYLDDGADGVRVWEDPSLAGTGFKFDQTLTPAVPIPGNGFGTFMAAYADSLIVGAPTEAGTGAAYLFQIAFGNIPEWTRFMFTVDEGTTEPLDNNEIRCIDADAVDTPSNLVITIDSLPVGGEVTRSGVVVTTADSFTQQDVLDGLMAWNDFGGEPGAPPRELLLTCTDTLSFQAMTAVNITVNPINDPPAIDLMMTTSIYTEGLGPVAMAAPTTTVIDPDSDIDQIQITALNFETGDVIALTLGASGLAFNPVTGLLSGTASPATYEGVLLTLTFDHSGDDPSNTDRVYELVATDTAGADSPIYTHTVTVIPVNDAPVLDVNTGHTQKRFVVAPVPTTELSASDPDDIDADITFTILANPQPAELRILVSSVPSTSFTQQDLEDNLVEIETFNPAGLTVTLTMDLEDPTNTSADAPFPWVITIDQISHVDSLNDGDLVINEIMKHPRGNNPTREWFEIYNTTAFSIDLDGLVISNGPSSSGTTTVVGTTIITPGQFGLFGHAGYGVITGNANFLYDLGASFELAQNGTQFVRLENSSITLDEVSYDDSTFPDIRGRALNYDGDLTQAAVPTPDTTNNNDGLYYCGAWSNNFQGTNYGTPGAINDDCESMDFDGDGFISDQEGGDDCNDNDNTIFPGAPDIVGDGIDSDCDGDDADYDIGDLAAGDLVITEFMKKPANGISDGQGEWIEVLIVAAGVPSGEFVDLIGLELRDEVGPSQQIVPIETSLLVLAGDRIVLGRNDDTAVNGGVAVDYEYDGSAPFPFFRLNNGADEIRLFAGATLIDGVDYDDGLGISSFPDPEGASVSLDPASENATDNDTFSNWCDGRSTFGGGSASAGQFGTPGAANETCAFEIDFDFLYTSGGGAVIEAAGATTASLDGHGTFAHPGLFNTDIVVNLGEGSYYVDTSPSGQFVTWTYDYTPPSPGTAITYTVTRLFGEDDWCGGVIGGPGLPAGWAGEWDQTGVCP